MKTLEVLKKGQAVMKIELLLTPGSGNWYVTVGMYDENAYNSIKECINNTKTNWAKIDVIKTEADVALIGIKESEIEEVNPNKILELIENEVLPKEYKKAIMELELIKFDNGGYLYKNYGKYQPNLCIIMKTPLDYRDEKQMALSEFNLGVYNSVTVHTGTFFKSKKGTNCFRLDPNGPHYLLKDSWGGAFNEYDGGELQKLNPIYFRRARSNGGGMGVDYAVINKNSKFTITEDDI